MSGDFVRPFIYCGKYKVPY